MSRENEFPKPEDLTLTHDGYFWETFQMKRIARAFLKKVLPKDTLACLDLDGLDVEERHLSDDTFKETIADVVYRVPMKGTTGHVNFFTVIEHKSYQDFLTIFQLWGYVYRVCRREFQAAQDRDEVKAGYRLPPVVAIILHQGETKFQGKTELVELFHPLPGLDGHLPRLQAILFDLNKIDDDDPVLNDPETPELKVVLTVMKMVFRRDVALKIKDVLQALKPYSDDPAMRRLIRATWVYLANNARHLKRNFETLLGTFEEVVGEKIMSTMVEIWKAEGEAIGEAKGVLRALTRQHGTVPESLAERIRAVTDIGKLDELFDLAFDCESLDEFAKYLP